MQPQYNNQNDFLTNYRSEMEKQAIEQAQEFLRRYNLFPPANAPANPMPASNANSGDLITIPVSAMEHAENAPVDAFRTFVFPNFSGNEIYTKKLDNEGKAVFQTYVPKGQEMTKCFEDMMKKIMGTLGYIDERMKSIEVKFDKPHKEEKEIKQDE